MTEKKDKVEKKQEKESEEEVYLSKQAVYNVMQFAQALMSSPFSNAYNYITPDLINQKLKDISYSPLAPTSSDITKALNDPKNYEEQLRSFVEYFEGISMPLKRIISYMASHLSFDLQYTVQGIEEDSEYTSKPFLKDKKVVFDYFDKFDYASSFRNISKQLLRNEIAVVCPREDKDKIVLQELPLQYCKITARGSYAPLISFDFYYFLQPGVDIDLYPDWFKQKYVELFEGKSNLRHYDPGIPPSLRGNSQYIFWVDLPPEMGWVFKLDVSNMTGNPYFSGLMPMLVNDQVMINLQKNINMAEASKIILGQVPMRKDDKTASVADMIAIEPVTLGKFMALIKSSLDSSVSVASAPLEDMKSISFEGNNELLSKWIQTSLSMSGMDTSLIYSMQTKANLIDSQLSFESDSKIMEQQLYPQFVSFLNYWVHKRTTKYRYYFRLEGNDYYLNRTQRFDRAMTLADKGIVLPQLIASSLGLKPQELERMLQESRATKFAEKLTPIVSAFQMSPSNDAGRPKQNDSELGESGAQTRESGSNIAKKNK